jgi:hypothetical protein
MRFGIHVLGLFSVSSVRVDAGNYIEARVGGIDARLTSREAAG